MRERIEKDEALAYLLVIQNLQLFLDQFLREGVFAFQAESLAKGHHQMLQQQ
jgi:hypothetical protein